VGVLLGCASLVITLAGVRAARDLVGTVFLALVLLVTAAPISRRLRKHRVRRAEVSNVLNDHDAEGVGFEHRA
jgi:predicted PurR-regulated permease PerM